MQVRFFLIHIFHKPSIGLPYLIVFAYKYIPKKASQYHQPQIFMYVRF